MKLERWTAPVVTGACAVALCAGVFSFVQAQQPAPGGRGGGRGGAGSSVFTAADANKDGSVTKEELRALFVKWAGEGASQEQLATAITAAFPPPAPPAARPQQNRTANPADVEKMRAALPDKAPAKAKRPRKMLVLSRTAGFVHSCIPLVDVTMQEMGKKTGAWTATVTYDAADISAANLKQYDVLFLNNTTGNFLDDPNDAAATAARKKALLEFVRGGKGLAGIHAASDSYHEAKNPTPAAAPTAGGGGRGPGGQLAGQILRAGDQNQDQKLSRDEATAVADAWYAKLDTTAAGKVSQADFASRFGSLMPANPAAGRGPGGPQVGRPGRDPQVGTWLEFNKIIGGFFKYHWNDPQLITVKIDDPKSPVTAMFHGKGFDINDETYTFGMEVWSRSNLHVLTSVDYDKMSEADKAKEDYPRADHDYGLSWIRREGKGRVFYEAHGHSERVYAIKPMLEHVLAGVQYALGDLAADDSPSVKAKK